MSEYAHRRSQSEPSPQTDTLFDDETFDAIDRLVDVRGISYDEARRIVSAKSSYERPEPALSSRVPEAPSSSPIEAPRGASVDLAARALALENIMATYNQLNKTMGATITSQYPDNAFEARYAHPEEVRENMGRKAAGMLHRNEADFKVLSAAADLIAVGFDQDEVTRQERRLKSELLDTYGPGKVYAPTRKRLVRTAKRTAGQTGRAKKKAFKNGPLDMHLSTP